MNPLKKKKRKKMNPLKSLCLRWPYNSMYYFRIQKSRVFSLIPLGLLSNKQSKSRITFSRKTGIASTTTADDRGSASIMYVKARQAWFIYK